MGHVQFMEIHVKSVCLILFTNMASFWCVAQILSTSRSVRHEMMDYVYLVKGKKLMIFSFQTIRNMDLLCNCIRAVSL